MSYELNYEFQIIFTSLMRLTSSSKPNGTVLLETKRTPIEKALT